MIKVNWHTYVDSDCDFFKVYRSICGFTIKHPHLLLSVGDKLIYSTAGGVKREIQFTATDIDSVLSIFEANGRGLSAKISADESSIIIRAAAEKSPRIKILGTNDMMTKLGIDSKAAIIGPQMLWEEIATIPRVPGDLTYSFTDPDGEMVDYYRITHVKGSKESIPSFSMQPKIPQENLCVFDGRITDAQNKPQMGVKITAKLKTALGRAGSQTITTGIISCETDEYGRFSLPLIRKQQYLLSIPNVDYNDIVETPDQPYADLFEVSPTLKSLFGFEGE